MKKFWTVKNQVNFDTAEILIYGDIASESWWGDEVTPKDFANDLAGLNGKDVCVRINSCGGDVFAAHAIHNQLKTYSGYVTVIIDGIVASAATIIAMAANKIIMPTNSMMMIHDPMLMLYGYYNADECEKMMNALGNIKDSIIAAYRKKCNVDNETLATLMKNETWMGAVEAKSYGFIDEISDQEVTTAIDGNFIVVNSIRHNMTNIQNAKDLQKTIKTKGELQMDESFLNKIKETIANALNKNPNQQPPNATNSVDEAVKKERERIIALDALKNENKAVTAIIDDAKKNGKCVDDIKPYIDIINANAPDQTQLSAIDAIKNLITDAQNSGGEGITADGNPPEAINEAEKEKTIQSITDFINKRNGRVN